MSAASEAFEAQRAFLDRYYGWSAPIYDVTRRYYLLGRDETLRRLADDPDWERLVEIGPGTGRNLDVLRGLRPEARFGGVEPSSVMRQRAAERLPGVQLMDGFAENADYRTLLGAAPDRVLFSYCLSMVERPDTAIDHALDQLAPGGAVIVCDFGDGATLWPTLRRALERWLASFHVTPLGAELLRRPGATIEYGAGRYWVAAELRPG